MFYLYFYARASAVPFLNCIYLKEGKPLRVKLKKSIFSILSPYKENQKYSPHYYQKICS